MPLDFFSKVKVRSRFFLSPMAEFTNPAMRKISIEFGAGMVWTEMAEAGKFISGDSITRKLLSLESGEHPIAGQIIASDPDVAARAAVLLVESGFDVVELNAGCAIRRIVSKGMGSSLLADLDRLSAIVRAMSSAIDRPVTVKLRSGVTDDRVNAVEASQVCQESGASAVAVHGRSAEAGYRGEADWSVIASVKESVSIPVFGSGGIRSASDALRMLRETRCDAVMVARGALGNPWLFRDAKHLLAGGSAAQLRAPAPAEVLKVMREHYKLLVAHAGKFKANLLFRRLAGYYCPHIPGADDLRTRIQHSRPNDDVAAILRQGV